MVSPTQFSQVTRQGTVEYPRSWYPFCLSKEVRKNKVINVRAFGREWVCFRNSQNNVYVMQRYCPHMGVDLTRGKVDQHLTCPLHNKKFPEVACQRERDGLPIQLKCTEEAGMVFVFLGNHEEEPLPGKIRDGAMSFLSTYDYPAPFQMVGLNGFDIHHLGIVHKRQVSTEPEVEILDELGIRINYQAAVAGTHLRDRLLRLWKIDSVDININCYAGSILQFDHKKINAQTLLCLLPVEKNRTRIFLRTILLEKKKNPLTFLMASVVQLSIIKFLKQDFEPLWDSRFMPEGMYQPEDNFAIQWLEHYDAIPKVSVTIEEKS